MLPPSHDYLLFAQHLADQARTVTLSYFRQAIDILDKNDLSPVTIADQQTEALLRDLIQKRFPEHGILGEEAERHQSEADFQWILDPIDGTRSFISGFPVFCTLIALFYRGEAIVSVVDMPVLKERFIACHDRPTELNGQRLQTRQTTEINQMSLFSTDPFMFSPEQFARQKRLSDGVKLRRYTGDAYLYAMLSAGWIDAVIEADLKPYDFLPLKLIVEQAGGVITDWDGQGLHFGSSGEVLASANPILHQKALEVLKR